MLTWARVTGRGYMDVNRISGYIPGKMVFFLMQARAETRPCMCTPWLGGPHRLCAETDRACTHR